MYRVSRYVRDTVRMENIKMKKVCVYIYNLYTCRLDMEEIINLFL